MFLREMVGERDRFQRPVGSVSALYLGTGYEGKGPGSVVGIATGYGLDGPGIESRCEARFSAPVQTGSGAHPAFCTIGTGSLPGGKVRPGRAADHSPHSSAVVMEE